MWTLCIGDYEYVNIASFAVLGIELWLEEDGDLKQKWSVIFIQIHSVASSRLIQNVIIFSYNFLSNIAHLKIFAYL